MPRMSAEIRRKSQPFALLEELWAILQLGAGTAPPIAWLLNTSGMQVTGLVPELGTELEIREAFRAWADLVKARRLAEVTVDGVTNLKAVAEAYGSRLIRVAIVAEIWLPGCASTVLA